MGTINEAQESRDDGRDIYADIADQEDRVLIGGKKSLVSPMLADH